MSAILRKLDPSVVQSYATNLCLPRVVGLNSRRGLIPYNKIPRAPVLPVVGSLLYILNKGYLNYHEYVDDLHKELGPIFISKIWHHEVVHVADADANFTIYQHEGRLPIRDVPMMWREHSRYRNHKRGLFFMDGNEWSKARSESNPVVAKLDNLEEHVPNVASITEEFINTWATNPPKDLRYYLYCWNVECIASTALGRRLGFLDKLKYFNKYNTKHSSEQQFIKDGCNIFTTSGPLLFKPISVYRFLNLKSWRRYCEAADNEILNGEKYVAEAIKECTSSNPSQLAKQSLLYKLIQNSKLDMDMIRRLFVELFLASPNSTSIASVWLLYSLGRHPEVAQKIREEMFSVFAEESLSLKTLDKLFYLSGAIRESLRIRPTTAFLTRILDSDADVCGYHVPAQSIIVMSMYTMGRNSEYFPYPEAFMPERWATRSRGKDKPKEDRMIRNRRAHSPFALGHRSCIGRNLAVMDMRLLAIEALKAYEWTSSEVDYVFSLVGIPSKNVDLVLKPYQK